MDRSRWAAAVTGALLASLVPHGLHSQLPVAHALWCWSTTPVCRLSDPNGVCKDATSGQVISTNGEVPAGTTGCVPDCASGLVSQGACSLTCPSTESIGGRSNDCISDLENGNAWWGRCGTGNGPCAATLTFGTDAGTIGDFSCVAPTADVTGCTVAVEIKLEDNTEDWDLAVYILIGCFVVLPLLGLATIPLQQSGMVKVLFKVGPMGWTIASCFTITLVIVGLIVFNVILGGQLTEKEAENDKTIMLKLSGDMAGLAIALPMWWAFFGFGVNNLFLISREAAWRIHSTVGIVGLVFGGIHWVKIQEYSNSLEESLIFSRGWYLLGPIGFALMVVGIFPALILHYIAPRVVSYDIWKMIHFLSYMGWVCAMLHMMDNARTFSTGRAWAVFIWNVAATVLFWAAKNLRGCCPPACTVESHEVSNEPQGKHIFLKLNTPSIAKRLIPGQWGHLKVPSCSSVAHPFTVVPDEGERVQLFIKVSGRFTEKLASKLQPGGDAPKMWIEGPYGIPALPSGAGSKDFRAVLFVVGGVGVTPALALIPQAREAFGDQVYLFWPCRSPALVKKAAPSLTGMTAPKLCVQLTQPGSAGESLGVATTPGRADLADWMNTCAADMSGAGVKSALLFVCGPGALAGSAKAAMSKAPSVRWHLHIEEFNFLPRPTAPAPKPREPQVEPQQVGNRETE